MLGAHNTLSFKKPKKLWQYIALPFAKCQSANFEELYDMGVRWFDIRVKFDKKGKPHFAHGIVEWDINDAELMESLWELNMKSTKDDTIYFRFLLEFNIKPKDYKFQEEKFSEYVESTRKLLSNCKLTDCHLKYDWGKKIPGDVNIKLIDIYSSVRWKSVFQTFTWLYSVIYNSLIKDVLKDKINGKNEIVLLDFI